MYRVILVDDEPIILSGIKFLIDWTAQNCEIVGTARNGQQALELIDKAAPDIVVCDIRMPVKSGIELLEEVNGRENAPVFIMLTNYQDFDLARQTLRLRAVDYLVKTQLDPAALESSLQMAKAECDKRGKLACATIEADYMQTQRTEALRAAALDILRDADNLAARGVLARQGAFSRFCLMQLMLDVSALPTISSFSRKDRRQLLDWECDVVEKLAQNLLDHFILALPDYDAQSLLLLCWDLDQMPDLDLFYSKLSMASANTTQVRLALLCSDRFDGPQALGEATVQLAQLRQYYYLSGGDVLTSRCLLGAMPALQPVEVHDLCNRLALELRAKNKGPALAIVKKAADLLAKTPHLRREGIHCCSELYSMCSMVLAPLAPEGGGFFSDTGDILSGIQSLATRAQVLDWLAMLGRQLEAQMDALESGHSDPLEKAREYVRQHVDERILLQDAAAAAGLSASYLSALFKKEYNQNFMDFVNETKMRRACQLIREGKYRIYEISYMLSFENAYYFTRVFRRHVGMTPTEYQRSLRPDSET